MRNRQPTRSRRARKTQTQAFEFGSLCYLSIACALGQFQYRLWKFEFPLRVMVLNLNSEPPWNRNPRSYVTATEEPSSVKLVPLTTIGIGYFWRIVIAPQFHCFGTVASALQLDDAIVIFSCDK